MTSVRVGIVGIGFGQQVLVPAFRRDSRVEVVALAASTVQRARKVADALGVPQAYGDWRALLADPSVDAIAIAVPPHIQTTIAAEAMRRGKPILCEKPLAASLAAARELIDLRAQHPVPAMVDLLFPEIPAWQEAKRRLGDIGPLRHVVLEWCVETYANRLALDGWKSRPQEGGGALGNFFSQSFFYLEWLFGPIVHLGARLFRAPGDTRSGETFANLNLELMSGLGISAVLATAAPLARRHRIEIFGEDGAIVLENFADDYISGFRLRVGRREAGLTEVPTPAFALAGDGRIAAAAGIIERFTDWITLGRPARPDLRDGLRVQELLDAAYRSHATRMMVDVA